MTTFADKVNQQAQQFGLDTVAGGNDFWKPSEGANKIRILCEPQLLARRFQYGICYQGAWYCQKENIPEGERLTIRYLTWIIDRADGNFYLYEMPWKVIQQLAQIQKDEAGQGFAFEEFPMPYDCSLHVQNAGKKEAVYTLTPDRKDTPLTQQEKDTLEDCTAPADIIEKMKDKARRRENGEETDPKAQQDQELQQMHEKIEQQQQEEGIDPSNIPF
jgi:hypothetical protein